MEKKEIVSKIQIDLRKSLQAKDELRVSVLRMFMAAVFNKEKEKRARLAKTDQDLEKLDELSKLTHEETLEVISSEVKKRKDSIEQFQKGDRKDLADKEKKELEILMEYLPKQMPKDEIRKIVKEKISQLGASSPSDAGKVMGQVMPQLKGKADGAVINKVVQEELK